MMVVMPAFPQQHHAEKEVVAAVFGGFKTAAAVHVTEDIPSKLDVPLHCGCYQPHPDERRQSEPEP